jgi:glycosyltransferase involved in cell wall biosynthesis
MKLLTVGVPCYNSQDYMEKCLDSLLTGGERVEIVIINDGSKDRTGEIADAYAAKYPAIVKAVHQENGGHGEGINQSLRHASG